MIVVLIIVSVVCILQQLALNYHHKYLKELDEITSTQTKVLEEHNNAISKLVKRNKQQSNSSTTATIDFSA